MLNNDSLEQLRALKQQITTQKEAVEAQRVRTSGTVKGSPGRFGFITLEDGRDIYLPPEQMQRVFPEDRVQIEIITGSDGKPSAVLEQLLESKLTTFTGQYVVRDNAHFVEPDLPRLSRWLFVPPKLRGAAKHGDWVGARINRHPFSDGKPQARIDQVIGAPDDHYLEQRYALARYQLADNSPSLSEAQLLEPNWSERVDLGHLPFVTIDGYGTQDMDDALYAVPKEAGWTLWVAIADPSAWIEANSSAEQTIAARTTSVYLPGRTVPMLPEHLSNQRCSLRAGEERLALVCELQIAASGAIDHYQFIEARIRSRARLNYQEVAAFLQSKSTEPTPDWSTTVIDLQAVTQALQQERQRLHLLMPDQPDYHLQLDQRGKISQIQRQEKTIAHRLVEESMVATNRCAANFLQDIGAIFVCHNGFRPERRDNVMRLVKEQIPALADIDITTPAGYLALMQAVQNDENPLPLRSILSRSLERSQIRGKASAHFGMGLPAYTTITSPIRKFNDFLLHRVIKAKLRGAPVPSLDAATLTQLQERTERARQASQLAEQWLKCEFMQRQLPVLAQAPQAGTISHINSNGFTVRLADSGIEGFVDLRHSGQKFSFDTVYLRISSATQQFQLEQNVLVIVASVDAKRRSIALELAAPVEPASPAPAQ